MTLQRKRALLAVRLSRMTDETTSPERQHEATRTFAAYRGYDVVDVAEDLDVSASKVPPMEREGLGPWLKDRAHEYDAIIWARLDRAVRSMGDLAELARWARNNNKKLIFVSGPGGGEMELDMTNAISELIMMILAFAAQMESQSNSERVSGALAHMRQIGRWGGGMVPYWCKPARMTSEGGKKGWVLVHNQETAAITLEMIRRVIAGDSMLKIARDLQAAGVPTPRDYRGDAQPEKFSGPRKWSSTTIGKILKSRNLLGETVVGGVALRNDAGESIKRCEPLITEQVWSDLQAALSVRALPEGRTANPNMFLGTLKCANCGGPLYRQQFDKKGNTYVYIRCHGYQVKHNDCNERFRGEVVEAKIVEIFLATVGGLEVQRREYRRRVDNSEEIMNVDRLIADLEDEYDRGLIQDRGRYLMRKENMLERRATLAAVAVTPAGYDMVGSGQTYRELWDQSTIIQRRELLRESKLVVYTGRPYARDALNQFQASFGDQEPGMSSIVELEPADLAGENLVATFFWTGDIVERVKAARAKTKVA